MRLVGEQREAEQRQHRRQHVDVAVIHSAHAAFGKGRQAYTSRRESCASTSTSRSTGAAANRDRGRRRRPASAGIELPAGMLDQQRQLQRPADGHRDAPGMRLNLDCIAVLADPACDVLDGCASAFAPAAASRSSVAPCTHCCDPRLNRRQRRRQLAAQERIEREHVRRALPRSAAPACRAAAPAGPCPRRNPRRRTLRCIRSRRQPPAWRSAASRSASAGAAARVARRSSSPASCLPISSTSSKASRNAPRVSASSPASVSTCSGSSSSIAPNARRCSA